MESWYRHGIMVLTRNHGIDKNSWYWQHPWYGLSLMVYNRYSWTTQVQEGWVLPVCRIFKISNRREKWDGTQSLPCSSIWNSYSCLPYIICLNILIIICKYNVRISNFPSFPSNLEPNLMVFPPNCWILSGKFKISIWQKLGALFT